MKHNDEEIYIPTEEEIMKNSLKDFGMEVSTPMAKAIFMNFMETMKKVGYIADVSDE